MREIRCVARFCTAKVMAPTAEIRFMNKEQAKAVLDSATAAAEAIVRARGDKITEDGGRRSI